MPIRAWVIAVTVTFAAALSGSAAAQTGPVMAEAAEGPRLHFSVAAARGARSPDKKAKVFRVDGVRLVDRSGKTLWKVKLPKRFADHEVVMDAVARGTHEQSPWLVWPVEDAITGVVQLEDLIVVADPAGLLVLEAKSGQTLVDWTDPNAGSAGPRPLTFDTARYTFGRAGVSACGGRAAKGRVLARCGDELVYFNGRTAALVSLVRPAEPANVRYEYDRHYRRGADAFTFGATLPLGDGELVFQAAIASH